MSTYITNKSPFPLPTLLFMETRDRFVKESAVTDFHEAQKHIVKKVVYEGAYHELFSEANEIRSHALTTLFDFIDVDESKMTERTFDTTTVDFSNVVDETLIVEKKSLASTFLTAAVSSLIILGLGRKYGVI